MHLTVVCTLYDLSGIFLAPASNTVVELSVDDIVDIFVINDVISIEHLNERSDSLVSWYLAGRELVDHTTSVTQRTSPSSKR